MNTLDGNLQENQLIYQQNFNENFLKNEKKKKYSMCLLVCGIVFSSIEAIIHFLIIIGLAMGIGFAGECDYEDEEKIKKCEKEAKIKEKKLGNALKFVIPILAISSIVIFLGVIYNKKFIILNFICILIKISLFIGYIIYIDKLWEDEDNSDYMFFMIFPEVISDIFFLVNAILICFIKKIF